MQNHTSLIFKAQTKNEGPESSCCLNLNVRKASLIFYTSTSHEVVPIACYSPSCAGASIQNTSLDNSSVVDQLPARPVTGPTQGQIPLKETCYVLWVVYKNELHAIGKNSVSKLLLGKIYPMHIVVSGLTYITYKKTPLFARITTKVGTQWWHGVQDGVLMTEINFLIS